MLAVIVFDGRIVGEGYTGFILDGPLIPVKQLIVELLCQGLDGEGILQILEGNAILLEKSNLATGVL